MWQKWREEVCGEILANKNGGKIFGRQHAMAMADMGTIGGHTFVLQEIFHQSGISLRFF
jgi:hypothetical protein